MLRVGQKKAPKRQFFIDFLYFFDFFPNIWPLAGPNIGKKDGSLQKLARVDRQTHFGTFNFWIKPGFWWFWRVLRMFWVFCACFAYDLRMFLEKAKLSSRDQVGC